MVDTVATRGLAWPETWIQPVFGDGTQVIVAYNVVFDQQQFNADGTATVEVERVNAPTYNDFQLYGCTTDGSLWYTVSEMGSLMAVGGSGNLLFLVKANNGKLFWDVTPEVRGGTVMDLLFTPDKKFLIARGNFPMIRVFDIEKKLPHAVFRFTSTNPRLNVWQGNDYGERAKHVFDIEGKYTHLGEIAITPDGKTLAVGGNLDGEIPLINLATGKPVKTVKLKRPYGSRLQFSQDGKWLVVGGARPTASSRFGTTKKTNW